MSRVFEASIEQLSKASGYSWDFLVDRYNEVWEDGDDAEYFVRVSLERDWTVRDLTDLRPEERPVYKQLGEQAWMRLAEPWRIVQTPLLRYCFGLV